MFFARPVLRMLIQQPLVAANRNGQYDVICTVSGGGLSGQAGAVRHGISKALTYFEPDLRGALKRGGFLTRDSARGRAQEVRQGQGAPLVPVLQALTSRQVLHERRAPDGRLFCWCRSMPCAARLHREFAEAGLTLRQRFAGTTVPGRSVLADG